MATILTVRGFTPEFGKNCFIAPNATVVGDVVTGEDCSIWFSAVIRGDVNSIRLGNKINVQDNVTIHCTYEKTKTFIGNNVTIGHNAVVHGCTLEDNVMVGMGAIVMDRAIVGTGSIIAAGAVVLQGTKIEPGSIYAGIPARRIKEVSKELREGEIERIACNYIHYASWFKEQESHTI